ncbi:MAG TPA: hypothetical protein VHQ90_23585 [Thermoanaerobaculia bacterium]|nr:hypothetical protein [Thermoanaerobaculia bacterium]
MHQGQGARGDACAHHLAAGAAGGKGPGAAVESCSLACSRGAAPAIQGNDLPWRPGVLRAAVFAARPAASGDRLLAAMASPPREPLHLPPTPPPRGSHSAG